MFLTLETYRMIAPASKYRTVETGRIDGNENYEVISAAEARPIWDAAVAAAPKFEEEPAHLITGVVLPVWDRLNRGFTRLVRAQTDDGERFLGRMIPDDYIAATLQDLGVEAHADSELSDPEATSSPASPRARPHGPLAMEPCTSSRRRSGAEPKPVPISSTRPSTPAPRS
jgi:hypothetical protein